MNLLQSMLKSLWNNVVGFIFKQRQNRIDRALESEGHIFARRLRRWQRKEVMLINSKLSLSISIKFCFLENTEAGYKWIMNG